MADLQNQLRECQLGSQPIHEQLLELQNLVELCRLQIATQLGPPSPGVKSEGNPYNSKGANSKNETIGNEIGNTPSLENIPLNLERNFSFNPLLQQQCKTAVKYSAPRPQKDTTLNRRNRAFKQMENQAARQQQNIAPEIASLQPPNVLTTVCERDQLRNWGEPPLESKFPQKCHAREIQQIFPPSVEVPIEAARSMHGETSRQPLEAHHQESDVEKNRRIPRPVQPLALGGILIREPTPQQLAARHVLPRELPTFSGNPADWPVFISNYKYTTEACGYSDGENMIRLQRCLKGAAWESVQSRLILPASIPQVIEALRMRYGRAELLIESLIDKTKSAPSPRSDRLETLIEFGMMVQALCDHIIAADLPEHLANPTLLKDLVTKLPADCKMQWAGYRRHQGVVNLRTFGNFMEEIFNNACSVSSVQIHEPKLDRSKMRDRHLVHSETAGNDPENECNLTNPVEMTKPTECAVCQGEGHRTINCKIFLALPVDERWRKLLELKLCRTCLYAHGRRACRSTQRCEVDGCQARHHRLLHSSNRERDTSAWKVGETVQYHIPKSIAPSLFFRILPVTLHSGRKSVSTFAFLDEGSSLTMIEKSLAAELGVTGYAKPLCLKWTSNVTREEPNSQRVTFEVSGEEKGKRFMMRDVGTIESLDLPMQNAPIEKLVKCYNHLKGLPIRSYRNAIPQLLTGVDNLRLIVPLKVHEGVEGSPTATKTRLGWCIYGGQGNIEYHPRNYHVCECGGESEFNDAIKKYFSFEETGVKSVTSVASEEDKRALRIKKQTTVHVKDRYDSGLLWKFDKFEFPDSYPMAYKRLQCLERRMAKDPALRENIERQLKEYQAKEYAHRATPEELASADPRRTWYLPLGAVMNSNKPGKMRLIWDASAKVDGVSLNTFLLKGPDQVTSLPTILFRFRRYRVAVSADIKEMFHQVKIRPEDRHAQRFLWRSNPTAEPEEFLMDVATFGSTCSPATAQYVKNTNAQLFAQTFPRAVEGIVLSHYVDDYLDSFHDEIEAKRVACEVENIHDYGGFDLRNWCSNSLDVLQHLG
ncbi:uncharacterized protein LOC129774196 [Toxorhynchites rutilus septentrionalis]|uniref:uncharacterized protein LOC129774196 n=1 Tax=Toxorhynchites rutilus septentrionalis TaxID=329112 RepID=UPI0024796883|nr:uncharacterized protein LOC129774196 [Toxorhynchites rutilus septentrionalis]